MKKLIYIGKYKNKCEDFKQLAIKWVCINPEIKDGDLIQGKTILLNLEKINRCIFYPVKNNFTVDSCNFIGSSEYLKGDMLKAFNLMVFRDDLSVEVLK